MQEQKAKWTFEQGGFSKALIACAPMGTGYHLHLIRFGRHTDFPLTYVFVPLDFTPPKLAAKDQKLEAYRAALKEKENVLAMSEVERQKQAAEIQKLEGYRNDLSDQLNEAEERLRELEPEPKQHSRPRIR